MVGRITILIVGFILAIGCVHVPPKVAKVTHVTAPFERYIAADYDWSTVQRIVLMPFANQVAAGYPKVGEEMCMSLASELQRVGRFEVVVASQEDPMAKARDVFASGQFNELDILRIAREHQADAVLFANVTQYHAYTPPRVGLSIVVLSPSEGIAIASASGLWDAREKSTVDQMNAYFIRTQNVKQSLMGSDRVTELPVDFQKFVCQQVAEAMNPMAAGMAGPQGASLPTDGVMPQSGSIPMNGNSPMEGMMPNGDFPPPVPPSPTGMQ